MLEIFHLSKMWNCINGWKPLNYDAFGADVPVLV